MCFWCFRAPARRGLRRKYSYQIRPFHFRPRFHGSNLGQLFNQALQKGSTDTLVNDFAAPEENRRFDFIPLLQETDDVIFFEFVIVLIGVWSELHFLDSDVLLMLLRFMKLLVHLVEVLSVVHDSANRRSCSWRYLYQIQATLFRDFKRLLRRHDSELFVLIPDHPDFSSSDSLVHPNVSVDGLDLPEIFG
jgi:hypothetical protein